LEEVVLTFCYPENPLFGKLIYDGEFATVYERSKKPKPASMPKSYDLDGDGILFVSFQARGSFVQPLIICNHNFETKERERHNLFAGTVVDMLVDLVNLIDAATCVYLLKKLDKYWYNYPKHKLDTDSCYPVIRKLIRKIAYYDTQLSKEFFQNHPNLVVCDYPTNTRMQNEKSHALRWKEAHLPNATTPVSGMAILLKKKEVKRNYKGYRFRYNLSRIEIKQTLLVQNSFANAFATYCHELCHVFGGDSSETFSYALTDVMAMSIKNSDILRQYNHLWLELFLENPNDLARDNLENDNTAADIQDL